MAFIIYFIFGFGVSIGLGAFFTPKILSKIRNYIIEKALDRGENIKENPLDIPLDIPAWLIGTIERIFFTILVAFNVSATAAAMMAWITIKMVSDWHRIKERNEIFIRSMAFSSLLGNIISMFFALVGGLIFSCGIK